MPYLTARYCETCANRHVYYPDKIRPTTVRLNSLDRGHPTTVVEDVFVQAIHNALV